jgi:hypothetical protein
MSGEGFSLEEFPPEIAVQSKSVDGSSGWEVILQIVAA